MLATDTTLEIAVFTDNTIIEVYWQGGRAAMTLGQHSTGSTGMDLFAFHESAAPIGGEGGSDRPATVGVRQAEAPLCTCARYGRHQKLSAPCASESPTRERSEAVDPSRFDELAVFCSLFCVALSLEGLLRKWIQQSLFVLHRPK